MLWFEYQNERTSLTFELLLDGYENGAGGRENRDTFDRQQEAKGILSVCVC
jgi:hypothetical protein